MRYNKASSKIARTTKTHEKPTKDGILDRFQDFPQFERQLTFLHALLQPFEKFVFSFMPAEGERRVIFNSLQSIVYSMRLPNMFHTLLPAVVGSSDGVSLYRRTRILGTGRKSRFQIRGKMGID
jgi:hypothetical protein